jgi:hypothetical protein
MEIDDKSLGAMEAKGTGVDTVTMDLGEGSALLINGGVVNMYIGLGTRNRCLMLSTRFHKGKEK